MAKIAIDAREYSTSTGRYISKLIENLEKIDTTNEYVVLLKEKDMESAKFSNPNFSSVMTPFKEFSLGEQTGFAKQLYGLKVDLVHYGKTEQPLLYLKRSITTVHDLTTARFINPDKNKYVFFVKQQIYKVVIWYAAHKSRRVIVPSNYVKSDLINYTHVRPKKVIVTHEAADKIHSAAEPVKGLSGQDFIMYIGRPTPHKNLWRLIEAFNSLKGAYPELKLVLAGKMDNNYKDIQKKVKHSDISGIVFTDYVSEGELRWLYENCQAYVFPSLSEGFGLPGLEAMAHGAPVVSSNATCLPEIYGDAAHYFDPNDVQSMASAIAEVLGNHELRAKLIKSGLEQVERYSWRRMASETMAVYNAVL
ncbi:MAG: glycosyltransferase family 4 protein [Candidatus Saccharimonadales bacterium]